MLKTKKKKNRLLRRESWVVVTCFLDFSFFFSLDLGGFHGHYYHTHKQIYIYIYIHFSLFCFHLLYIYIYISI